MSTRGTITIFDESNKPLLSIYNHYDSYFDGLGKKLQDFLSNYKIVNGFSAGDNMANKVANGMNCLAAQIIKTFKEDIGGIYILNNHNNREEYYYEVKYKNGKLILTGTKCCDKSKRTFPLYKDESDSELNPVELVSFKYDKGYDEVKWREIELLEEHDTYLIGLDMDDNKKLKRFNKNKIVSEIYRVKINGDKE